MKKFLLITIACNLLVCSGFSQAEKPEVFTEKNNSANVEELPYYQDASFSPYWLSEGEVDLTSFHSIPAFSFTDQSGNTISDKDLDNKIYVAGFFFSTCPGICPTVRSKLIRVQETFKGNDKVRIVQHSIRPSTDSIEVLQAYANKNKINNEQWYLLTGDKDEIYTIAKQAYFASEDLGNVQKNKDFLHTESLLLIDKNKHIRGIYNGLNAASVQYLIKDIQTLQNEKS
ncbi:SCO family protein [Alteromonas macleodii]|uniref:SCO family protein n=2 Tax=root TaxID=1 RepID=A0A6T9XZP8_ALTMA|nr:SCO family protein [Alteromonas macleodii]CAB9494315.1 SCO family protein [Alteromonas macleodii]